MTSQVSYIHFYSKGGHFWFTYLQFETLACRKHTIDVLISRPKELIMNVPHEDCFKEKQWVHRSIRC